MSDLVQLIQEADLALFEVEQSRAAVDAAKYALEAAKEDFEKARASFDLVIAKADELGVPRAKIKKLVEERSAVLLASGLLSTLTNQPRGAKVPKAKKAGKASKDDSANDTTDATDSPEAAYAFEQEDNVIQMDA